MNPHIGDLGEPAGALIGEVRIPKKLAAVEKAGAEVADRSLDFAFCLRAIRTARANTEAPVRGEAPELGIFQQLPAARALIFDDDGLELIEQHLHRHATEVREGALQHLDHRERRLPWHELHIQLARVAEDDEHRVALAPRQLHLGEIELSLPPGRRLKANDRLRLLPRPDAGHIIAEARHAPDIPGGPTLGEQSLRGEGGIRPQSLVNERLKRIQSLGTRRGRPDHRRLDDPHQLPGRNPVMDCPRADA